MYSTVPSCRLKPAFCSVSLSWSTLSSADQPLSPVLPFVTGPVLARGADEQRQRYRDYQDYEQERFAHTTIHRFASSYLNWKASRCSVPSTSWSARTRAMRWSTPRPSSRRRCSGRSPHRSSAYFGQPAGVGCRSPLGSRVAQANGRVPWEPVPITFSPLFSSQAELERHCAPGLDPRSSVGSGLDRCVEALEVEGHAAARATNHRSHRFACLTIILSPVEYLARAGDRTGMTSIPDVTCFENSRPAQFRTCP